VEQVRQFRTPLELDGLEGGINVICGPNESGKSTLVRAIRAAFFERHRSSSVDDLQPWGDSAAAPSISLEFEWEGQLWRLEKSFLRRKRCDLQIDGERLNGDEAEERLARLLGFEFPGRGASRPEHWGIPGLLWVEQGRGQDVHEAARHAGDHLKSALGRSLGEIASDTGDTLISAVARARAAVLTPGTGRPTGEYASAIQHHAELDAELAELDDKIRDYREQVDRLDRLLRQQTEEAAERPWETYRDQARAAARQLAEVEGWIAEQQRGERELENLHGNRALLSQQLEDFQREAAELTTRAEAHAQADRALRQLQAQTPLLEAQLAAARHASETARTTLQQAQRREYRERVQRELEGLEPQLRELDERVQAAQDLQQGLRELRARLQTLQIDPTTLAALRDMQQELSALQIRQQASATRLRFDLLPGARIGFGGEMITAAGERLLLEATELDLPEIGRLRIEPGGTDLPTLTRRYLQLQGQIDASCAQHGIDSVSHAEQRHELCRSLETDISRNAAVLASVAPDGLDSLLERRTLAGRRRSDLIEQLQALPGSDASTTSTSVADAQVQAAEQALATSVEAAHRHHSRASRAEQALEAANAELQRARHTLLAPDRQTRETQTLDRLTANDARIAELRAAQTARLAQIEAARPEILQQDLTRFERTADELEAARNRRALELTGLQGGLAALGAEGLEEARAERALAWEAAGRRRGELQRRAEALTLLLDLLHEKRQALTRRLQAPLQRHLNHYLQLLFPAASLTVDADLIPTRLSRSTTRDQEHAEFDTLSFGAREQMGLISRLAYADLLKDAGRPTLIILDDALVHTDRERLAQMKRILFDAAQRHQILLFSCHPETWQDLGVAARELKAARA
jgi:DNA repair exonuclease SbcCD ATPase subunit